MMPKCRNLNCKSEKEIHNEGYCEDCFSDLKRIRENNKKFEEAELEENF